MITVLPPMFAGLEPEDQAQARGLLQPVRFTTGEVIMERADDDTAMAFLLNGTAEVVVGESRIALAAGRDTLGEMELFTGRPRLATARALNQVDLLVLDADGYVELCETGNPVIFKLEQHVLRKIGDRLRAMSEQIVSNSAGSPFEVLPPKLGLLDRLNPFKRKPRAPELDITHVLANSPLFSWAQSSELDALSVDFTTATFTDGTRICTQGELGEHMFLIAGGQVDVHVEVAPGMAEHIATIGPGLAFGDSSIIHGCPRTAHCTANGDVDVLVLDRDHFLALMDSPTLPASVLRQGLIRNLVESLERATERFVLLDQARMEREDEYYKATPVSSVWRD